jgi:hypothetical protein
MYVRYLRYLNLPYVMEQGSSFLSFAYLHYSCWLSTVKE